MRFGVTFDASWRDKYADKLAEAAFFLAHMREVAQSPDPWPFTYFLRAFLAAMRSATAYGQAEAGARGRKAEWYALHDADPLREFLRALRDENLHVGPIHPQKTASVALTVAAGAVVVVEGYKSEEGGVRIPAPDRSDAIAREEVAAAPVTALPRPPAERTVIYRFPSWAGPGSNEVIGMCERYVESVEQLFADAVAAGIIVR